jgi:tRNA-specific 2-thiouridylase
MGLPHFTLDLQKQFRREVVDDFIAAYNAGATPNPCIRCNGIVRFDGMLSLADQLGAAGLCTGHYARIGWDAQGPIVERALDEQKDQSYMLARLDPAKLRRISFPLGELTKQRVRQIARDGALPVADKRESQDLCFMAGVNRGDFLKKHAPKRQPSNEPRGEIVDTEGRVLGYHGGHQLFTVGQRKGLGIASEQPLYVLSKDADRNAVVVGSAQELNTHQLVLEDAQLFRSAQAVDQVKVRYRSQPVGASLSAAPPGRYGRLEIGLSESLRGIAPGQVACLMRGDAVIGYGTIATS